MTWLAWAGVLLRFIYIVSGLKGLVERYRARQEGKRDEQLERTVDVLEDAKDARRTRNRVDTDDDLYDELYKKYRRD